jgi:imidazolonepropionase
MPFFAVICFKMSNLLIVNIKALCGILDANQTKLAGKEMGRLNQIENAFLCIENGRIKEFGSMQELNESSYSELLFTKIDAKDKFVLPSFVDSHTHIVFAKTREDEFVMRIKGKSYEEIAEAGGGILNSAMRLQAMSEDELYTQALARLNEIISFGTGAVEIKSGYGLTVMDELKMLRVIKRLKAISPIPIKATFLGAHAFPLEFKNNHQAYIRLILDEMLPLIIEENLADYIDVFCDIGFFSPEETNQILEHAAKFGLNPKIHGNELGYTGGVQVAVKNKAISVDHLEYTGDDEIECLLNSQTMPVALPGCSFFLGIPYAPFRKMIDAGLAVCLASDYNPGSTPNGRMGFVFSLACIQMKLTPEEAINAMTINGAAAIEMSHELGSITAGKLGNVFITKPINSLAAMPYYFGVDQIETVILNGKVFTGL